VLPHFVTLTALELGSMESITREDVEKLASSYSGACYVIIGHSRAGYAHWNDVKVCAATLLCAAHKHHTPARLVAVFHATVHSFQASVDAVIMYLDGRHGKGKWMALYGGDAPGSRAGRETVGNVMQCVKSAEPAAVVAIQSSHMQSKGRGVAASTATHVHYYPTVRGVGGAAVFGGVQELCELLPRSNDGRPPPSSAHRSCHAVAATAVYLGSGVRCHLAGVIAFGGGLLALQEAQFALSHCVPFKYIPCRARKCLAEHAPFGAIHVWAAAVRGRVREWRSAQAFHSQEGRGSSAEAAGAGAGVGAGARAGAGAGAQLPGAVGRVVVPRLVGAQLEDRGMCLTMHQPWASLLVAGIKRVEGRGWNTSHRGPLWIHAGTFFIVSCQAPQCLM